MLSFRSVQYTNFALQGKNAANEATDGCVRTFNIVAPKVQSQLCELSRLTFGFTMQEFSMLGGYTENPENHKSVKIGE